MPLPDWKTLADRLWSGITGQAAMEQHPGLQIGFGPGAGLDFSKFMQYAPNIAASQAPTLSQRLAGGFRPGRMDWTNVVAGREGPTALPVLANAIQGGNSIVRPAGLPGRAPVRPAGAPKRDALAAAKRATAKARMTSRVTRAPTTAPVVKPKATRLTQRY